MYYAYVQAVKTPRLNGERNGSRAKFDARSVVDRGLELMFLRGFNAVSVKDLVDAVGMPKGSFYNHFRSKEEFGLAVLERYSEEWHSTIKRYLADRQLPAKMRLESYFEHLITVLEDDWQYTKGSLVGNFSQELGDVNELFARHIDLSFRIARSYVTLAIEDAQREGSVDPSLSPESTAEFLLDSFEGALLRMKSARSSEPLKAFKAVVFGAIVR